ncbi:MAG: ribbon-helix-helix domain-containing protein [Chloroflexi bacterium]|nr:ribbon-helix-helix domain-containing protein [Chloroflexota bacterium]MCI0576746.1 ribbon-helix-helix domain-containing protein [Chloroflexota bacterium]MCI0645992.1 ribbon-helix-helix domain-containing protein [Chloroflexota bacterium]MCI0726859.1 ribbon-helix-helix domain-containing protein [Chloroflexota bacterium]
MVRTQVQLTEEQSQILKRIALEQGVSIAELIRQSVDGFIQSINEPTLDEKRQKALAIAGKYSSNVTDLSVNHDKYLAETYADWNE